MPPVATRPVGAAGGVTDGEGDGENVGGDVFDGEVAAEEDFAGDGQAEGVDWGDGNEAAELEQGGDNDGDCCDGYGAKFGEDCGEEPVECDRPEDGAQIFIEEPWEAEWKQSNREADGDGDEQE